MLLLCTAEVTKMKDVEDLDRLVNAVSILFFVSISTLYFVAF
jgi:hypothetical protein